MSRTLTEIYTQAKNERNKYLELTEFQNSSKMSILDAFTWVVAACIWSFDNILDVFKVDLANDLRNRINGTPAYFANALLKYQSGDNLIINEDGTSFSYASIDENKRIISKVSYSEVQERGFNDKLFILKIATGESGAYKQIEYNEMLSIRQYLSQILFAGQHAIVVSRKGDILIPKITVYYDGAVEKDVIFENIKKSINEFISNLNFDDRIYVQHIIDYIQKVEHVTDISMTGEGQGIYYAQYNDDDHLIEVQGSVEQKVDRYFIPNSGYIKESTKTGEEATLQTWKESIILKLEDK